MGKNPRKIFPGWWLVFSGGIIAMLQHAYHTHGLGAFFKPISAELGFSRAATAVVSSIGRFEGGIEAPLVGWITDKFGPRWPLLAGTFVFGAALILMLFVRSLWAFYVVWGVLLGLAFNLATTVPLRVAISNWFVKKRGTAHGIQMTMSGLSGVLVLPVIAWMIIALGWRMTVVIGGIIIWVVCLPLIWFFVKQRRPEYYGLLPDGATVKEETAAAKQMIDRGVTYAAEVQEVEFTLRQALRTPTFWLIAIAEISHVMTAQALNLHTIPFLTDIGIGALVAAWMYSLRLFVGLPFRFFGGLLADRLPKNRMRFLMGGGYLLQALGTGIFLLQPTVGSIYVWFILYGMGQGIAIAIRNPLMGRYFGRKAFGSITGLTTALMSPGAIFAPIYFGWIYDTTGNYMSAFILVVITVGFAGLLASFIPLPKPPAVVSDVHKLV